MSAVIRPIDILCHTCNLKSTAYSVIAGKHKRILPVSGSFWLVNGWGAGDNLFNWASAGWWTGSVGGAGLALEGPVLVRKGTRECHGNTGTGLFGASPK